MVKEWKSLVIVSTVLKFIADPRKWLGNIKEEFTEDVWYKK
jgi:hypothetical protein